MPKKKLSNLEIVTLAVYLLGGEAKLVTTEDVAIKANELAPGRFVWRKYRDQVNLEIVRVRLSEGKSPDKGSYLIGSGADGWMLSERGLEFATAHVEELGIADLSREPLSPKERAWRGSERARILASDAFQQYQERGPDGVELRDIEALFRVDSYVVGKARQRKVVRLLNTFGDDPEMGAAVRELARRLEEATSD